MNQREELSPPHRGKYSPVLQRYLPTEKNVKFTGIKKEAEEVYSPHIAVELDPLYWIAALEIER